MASEPATARRPASAGSNSVFYVIGVVVLLGVGIWGYTQYIDRHNNSDLPLTPEAKAYTRNLQLSDVEMKASENYFQQTVVEIAGKIANVGDRPLDTVEIYCVFRDGYEIGRRDHALVGIAPAHRLCGPITGQRPGTLSTVTIECGSGACTLRGTIREPCSAPLSSSRYCASELTRQRS